jgi:predicted O-methyltransferase YrrM
MELNSIQNNAKSYGVPIIRTESHKILEQFTKEKQPLHILEIGMAVGFSGITMLSACDGDLITIEHNKDYIKQAKSNFKSFGLSKRVKILQGDCHIEIVKLLYSGKYDNYFDLIFLDGPKAQYNLLLDGLLQLLKPDGVFIADNVLFRGYVDGTTKAPTRRYKTIIKRLSEFIDNCKNHEDLKDFKLIDTEDGIIFARKK